ncbi:MAG: imelysin family protein [Geminicoccaceae bacterium]
MPRPLLSLVLAALVVLPISAKADDGPTPRAVIDAYGDLAQAMYGDSLIEARALDAAVGVLLAAPSEETLADARAAWRVARAYYMQTETFRFGNPVVDEWEGRVNSWPLDEGLIDYVDPSYGDASDENPLYRLNVIANKQLRIGPDVVDASTISKELLAGKLQEALDVEKNVATGYHAIEFLLWGQDLNGTGPGAGDRPWTDYALGDGCTHGNCDRRRDYLAAASGLLIDDLAEMVVDWDAGGAARTALAELDDSAGLTAILTGIGSLSYGELAGERMKLGLLLHDPEEEHDCFSDNTHDAHYYDQVGMLTVWNGRYEGLNGKVTEGPSIAMIAAAKAPEAKAAVDARMAETLEKLQLVKDTAVSGEMAYDQMLAADNPEGNAMLQAAIDGLVAQTRAIEAVVAALNLKVEVEGSDSLDNPASVVAQ